MRALEWNINLATNKNKNSIPDFVGKEITKLDVDIFILTEICYTNNFESFVEKYIIKNNYNYIITSNSETNQNDILIAWKKNKYEMVNKNVDYITTDNNNVPNFAHVCLKDKNNIEFVIAGVRITLQEYDDRKKQMEFVLKELSNFENIILLGDLNCLRRETCETNWNINVISELCENYQFDSFITPKGQSIYSNYALNRQFEFAIDHCITKNVHIDEIHYDRNFTLNYRDIYIYEKDFTVYDYQSKTNAWAVQVGSGYPDHAMLVVNVTLKKPKEN